MMHQWIYL